jgi:acyl carrier protein
LFRCSLVRLAPNDHLLILNFDHIIIDGWSHGVFLSELTALYEAFLGGRPSPLPELPIQYSDFAAWQQRWMNGNAIASHVHYWREQLRGAPPLLELPTDRPRPRIQSFRGARLSFTLDKQMIDSLAAVGRAESCTLFMVLLAAFQTLLAGRSGAKDIVIGSPIANRNRHEVEPLIGSFMNTLALRGDLSGDPTFLELLQRVRKTALDAYAHQDLPFEKLVAELQPARHLSHSPIFQVMFILQNTPAPTTQSGTLRIAQQDIDAGSSKMDLTLNLEETPNGCVGWVEYSTDLFERSTIERFIEQYQSLLKSIVDKPASRLSELAVEPVAEESNGNAASNRLPVSEPGEVSMLGTSIETKLASIWSEVLSVQQVAPDDNLFDLGGHSLLITRIISRIRNFFQIDIPIHAFFETPTVAAIAARIQSELETGKPIRPAPNQIIRRRSVLQSI